MGFLKLTDNIDSPDDLKKLRVSELETLADEIRGILLGTVSKTGGHLASNLGVVELTIALHYVFDAPEDKIIWDVGHQTYVHKILTGRREEFKTLRQINGLSGFPKGSESCYDAFDTGHSSTSISAALGMAAARDIKGGKNKVIAVIGDGSMTGGLAYEALNNAGRSSRDIIVILNDNQMSIDRNVGALSRHLNDIRLAPAYLEVKEGVHRFLDKVPFIGKNIDRAIEITKDKIKYMLIPGIMFEELGFTYIGDINGHDTKHMIDILSKAKEMKGPLLLHVYTTKGKGYRFSEKRPCEYHGVSSFDIGTGKPVNRPKSKTYSDVFGETISLAAQKDSRIVAVSAAMAAGTGLEGFSKRYPERFFDVGIAEQHAVTFSAGLAKEGLTPVFAVYSSFLQRAYDQIIHDVAMQNLHVVFAVDRAGIVGADGETHQGVFDLSFMSHIPNMTVMAPASKEELCSMLEAAFAMDSPVAVRYPRGAAYSRKCAPVAYGKGEVVLQGEKAVVFSIGVMLESALSACLMLKDEGIEVSLVNARFMKPLDEGLIKSQMLGKKHVFTVEDNVAKGGFGESVARLAQESGFKGGFHSFAFPDEFICHGSQGELFKKYGLDADSMALKIKQIIKETEET